MKTGTDSDCVPDSVPSHTQLRWQCRRGMRELDILLSEYLERQYPQADEAQKRTFRGLLSLPDPELNAYLLGGDTPEDSALAGIVRTIRDRSQT